MTELRSWTLKIKILQKVKPLCCQPSCNVASFEITSVIILT